MPHQKTMLLIGPITGVSFDHLMKAVLPDFSAETAPQIDVRKGSGFHALSSVILVDMDVVLAFLLMFTELFLPLNQK